MALPPGTETLGFTAIAGLLVAWNKHRNVSKDDCEKEQAKCSGHICTQISLIKDAQKAGQKAIEKTNAEIFGELRTISEHMGAVKQFMKMKGG